MENPKTSLIIIISLFPSIANYAMFAAILGAQAFDDWPGLVHVCMGDDAEMTAVDYGSVFVIWMVFVTLAGIIGDIYLRIFLKLKNHQDDHVALVPVELEPSMVNYDEQAINSIPVKSITITICTSCFFIFCLGLLLMPIGMEAERFVVLICYGVLQVPLVIGITAKLDKNKVNVEQHHH